MSKESQYIVGIVGSRTFNREQHFRCRDIVRSIFDKIPKTSIILSGGAMTGADYWAKIWAQALGYQYIEAPASWHKPVVTETSVKFDDVCLRGAGHARNTTIAKLSSKAYAVWDMKSTGTQNVINKFYNYEVPLEIIRL